MVALIIKYIFRLTHITSFGIYFAMFFNDFMSEHKLAKTFSKPFHAGLGTAFLVSGFVNMIILLLENRYKKDKYREVWKYLLFAKTLILFGLMPPFNGLINKVFDLTTEDSVNIAKFYIFLAGLVLSPFTRYFRESYLTINIEAQNNDAENRELISVE